MLAQFQSGFNQPSFSDDCGIPVAKRSLCPFKLPSAPGAEQAFGFGSCEEDPVPHESGLAQENSSIARVSIGKTPESSWDPPPGDNERPQGQDSQADPGFSYGVQGADYAFHHDDEEDDDKEFVADPPLLDGTYARLVSFIHDRFPHSRPSTAAYVPPRCEFEDFFSINDSAPSSRQNLMVYPRVAELVSASADRASRLARESRPPSGGSVKAKNILCWG